MDISIENYGTTLSNYDIDFDTITLGYEFKHAKKIFSDNDFDAWLCDVITHEFLHRLLLKEFDITVCKLFDAIEHFIRNSDMTTKLFKYIRNIENSDYPMTWHDSITNEGFKAFMEHYHISNNNLIQAYIIAGGKQKC